MSLTDLRRRTKIRSQYQEIGDRIVDPDLRENVERLFDRPEFVSDVETLLDDHKLAGTEVLTIDQEMAPISAVRHVVRPALRQKLEKMLKGGGGDFTIKPSPEIRITTTVGFPGVRVAPSETRSVSIEYVPNPRGDTSASTDIIGSLKKSMQDHTYILLVNGTRYPIEGVEGNVLELALDPQFSSPRHGLIYNGADRFLMVATRTWSLSGESVKERKAKSEVRNLQERPIPLVKAKSLPGVHDVSVVGKNKQDTVQYRSEARFDVPSPPPPGIGEVFYVFGRPERDADGKNKLNESLTKLGVAASIDHPDDQSAVIVGARYRVATKSASEWKYGEKGFAPVRAEAIRWQMQDLKRGDEDTLGLTLPLGEHSSGQDRRVELKFLDELGRVAKREVVEKKAVNPEEGQLIVHRKLPDRFGRFVDGSSIPLRTDVRTFYDDADAKIEDLKAKAESIIENKTVEEIPVEEFQPPNARLKLEAAGGRAVDAQGAQSGHPNGLDMEYRFRWGKGDGWDTEFGPPTRLYTFDESGERSVTLQVRDEVKATGKVTETIVFPKPVLNFAFQSVDTDGDGTNDTNGNKTVVVDPSNSTRESGTVLFFRYAYQKWDDETSYASGEVAYYAPNKTIYKVKSSVSGGTTKGLDPTDGSEWTELPFGTDNDPANVAYHDYGSSAQGEKPVYVQVKDSRGAIGETTESVYIPNVDLNFNVDGDTLTITEDNVPDGYEIEYRFDWNKDGTPDTGFRALPIEHPYSDVKASDVLIDAQGPSGAQDSKTFSVPEVQAGLSVSPVSGTESKRYEFDAKNNSSINSGASGSLEYRFDFTGDGEWDRGWGPTGIVEHSYSEEQIAEAVVEVRDTNLGVTRSASEKELVYSLSPDIQGGSVTVQPSSITSNIEGEVFEYRYSWGRDSNNDPQYSAWSQEGRRTNSYPVNLNILERTIDVEIREANKETPPTYPVSDTVYWPKVSGISISDDLLVVSLDNVSANVSSNAPFGTSDLEWKIDFGSGEDTIGYMPKAELPDYYTYSSEGGYAITVRVRAPSGAVDSKIKNITLGVDLTFA